MPRLHVLLALLPACSPGHLSLLRPAEDPEHWEPNPDSGGPDDSGEPAGDGESPWIRSVDAWCYTAEDTGDWWGMKAVGDDPQGAGTLSAFIVDGVEVRDQAGARLATLALVCDAEGQCWTSSQAEHVHVACRDATRAQVWFWIEDEEGHRSEGVETPGRGASGPGG